MTRNLAATALLLGLCAPVFADEACTDNFVSEGNLLTGRSFKTWVVLPGVARAAAMSRAQAFTAENGFTVVNADRDAGTLSAAQSNTHASGHGAPLNLSFRDEAGGTRVTLSFALRAGQFATEDSIRRHFCSTVAAASQGGGTAVGAAPTTTTSATTSPTTRGYAPISPAQMQAIGRAFDKPAAAPKLQALVAQAAPAVTAYVARMSCLAAIPGSSALNEFAAPDHDLAYLWALSPMRNARYHDKGSCMTVVRAQGFTTPAANALKFEVVYKADDSGETTKMTHEAVRQPDGQWLFNN